MFVFMFILVCISAITALPAQEWRKYFRMNQDHSGLQMVGGEEVTPHSVPWQVSVHHDRGSGFHHFCGGTLVDKMFVITAAHCTDEDAADKMRVVLGDHSLTENDGKEQTINVAKIMPHEDFHFGPIRNDISILALESPVDLSDGTAALLRLPPFQREDYKEGGRGTVTGWGAEKVWGHCVDKLHGVTIDLQSDETCQQYWGSEFGEQQLCIGNLMPGAGPCNGDSGGPVACTDDEGLYHCGIVSFGKDCSASFIPDVYTQVSYFRNWIDEKISAYKAENNLE